MMDAGRTARYKGRARCFAGCLEHFMRIFVVAVLATSLLANGAFAQALAPGRPAGVHQAARMTSSQTALMMGAGAVIMAGVGILISGNSSAVDSQIINSQNNVVAPPVSTVVVHHDHDRLISTASPWRT